MTPDSEFQRTGHARLSGLLSPELTTLAYDYAMLRMTRGQLDLDEQTGRPGCAKYGDPLFETLLLHLQPRVEAVTGCALLPTYSYLRVYTHGSALERHADRESCEFTLTVTLGYRPDVPWPIWLETDGGPLPVEMAPGDGLLMRGRELPHWRERFPGKHHAQAFFHFVDRDGPLAAWRYDKRMCIGLV